MNKVASYLSLAKKAGKVVSGEFSSEEALKKKKAKLLLIAEDASENTKKQFLDGCAYRHVPCMIYGTKDELGACIGAGERSSVAVLDEGLTNAILKELSNGSADFRKTN